MQLHYEKRKGNNFLQVTVWQTFHIIDILVLAFCYEPVIICIQKYSTKPKKKYKKMSSLFPDLQDSPFHPLSLPPLSTFVRQLSRNTFKEDYQEIVHNNYQEILSKNTSSAITLKRRVSGDTWRIAKLPNHGQDDMEWIGADNKNENQMEFLWTISVLPDPSPKLTSSSYCLMWRREK